MRVMAILTGVAVSACLAPAAGAAVTPVAYWRFGDKAGDTAGTQDSVGTANWSTNGAISVQNGGAPVFGSTKFLATPGSAGLFGPNTGALLTTDNWGVELWARTASTTQSADLYLSTGPIANGTLKISQNGANWAPSYHNVAWIGADSGAGQPVTANTWTHLAIVRSGGVSTFYLNGVARSPTTTGAPVFGNSAHLSVNPGGAAGWDGDVDEMRYFTFTAGQFNAATDLLIPEPASLGVLGLAAVGLLGRRRIRRARR